MKVIVAGLTALALFTGTSATVASAAPADGYRAYEVKHRYVKRKPYVTWRKQYWAERMPYGSSSWWQQMDREQRGGRR